MKVGQAFSKAKCDKGYVHGYDRYYDQIFEDFIPDSLLEVGISSGNSLYAWKMLFANCNIHGIDITKRRFNKKLISYSKAKITIADSTKPNIKDKIKDNYDIIIDDGSHYYKDIMRTFKNLHTKFNRYYIIEDWYYDKAMIERYINKFGFYNVSFHISDNSKIPVKDSVLFRCKRKTSSIIDQNMIIIKR